MEARQGMTCPHCGLSVQSETRTTEVEMLRTALHKIAHELTFRVRTVHCRDGKPLVNVALEALDGK